MPLSNHARTDLREVPDPERRLQVEPEVGLVLFLAARAKGWPLLFEPHVGVLPERDVPLLRWQPRPPLDVSPSRGRERLSVSLLGDRSFDHDNDTEREDGIHRMDAHIVADEETVKAADDPHMLDFRP